MSPMALLENPFKPETLTALIRVALAEGVQRYRFSVSVELQYVAAYTPPRGFSAENSAASRLRNGPAVRRLA